MKHKIIKKRKPFITTPLQKYKWNNFETFGSRSYNKRGINLRNGIIREKIEYQITVHS